MHQMSLADGSVQNQLYILKWVATRRRPAARTAKSTDRTSDIILNGVPASTRENRFVFYGANCIFMVLLYTFATFFR